MTAQPGALERLLGGAPIDVLIDGVQLPASAIGPATVRRGRSSEDAQPSAAQLSLTLATDKLTLAPVKGSRVDVRLTSWALGADGTRTNLAAPAGDVDGVDPVELAQWWAASGAGTTLTFVAGTVATHGALGVRVNVAGTSAARGAKIGSNLVAGKGLPVDAGQVYTFGLDTIHSVPGTQGSRIVVQWLTAAGAAISSDDGPTIASAPDFPRRRTITLTAPAGAAWAVIYGQFLTSTTGNLYGVDGVTMERGTTDGSWFDSAAQLAAAPRFTGRVTDLRALPATRRQQQPQLQLTAVGPRSRALVAVGDLPWPDEPVRNRVERIALAASALRPELEWDYATSTLGPTIRARDVDRQPAAGLVDELADDTGGILVERRDGVLRWLMPDQWRDGLPDAGAVTLDSSVILVPSSFRQSPSGVVNSLRLTYGVDTGAGQPYVDVVDPAAAADDLQDAKQDTQLRDLTDAAARARDIVGRRSRPRWRIEGLALDAKLLVEAGLLSQVAGLECGGGLVRVRDLPTTGPYTDARLLLEGMTESWTRTAWTIDLDVTEYGVTAPAPRLVDVPGYAGAATPAAAPRWSWRTQRLEWSNGTPATDPAPSATSAPRLSTIDPDLTLLAAAGWDPDPLS